jgi:hypothetical protein
VRDYPFIPLYTTEALKQAIRLDGEAYKAWVMGLINAWTDGDLDAMPGWLREKAEEIQAKSQKQSKRAQKRWGDATAMPRDSHGNATALPPHSHGNATEVPAQCHGNATAMQINKQVNKQTSNEVNNKEIITTTKVATLWPYPINRDFYERTIEDILDEHQSKEWAPFIAWKHPDTFGKEFLEQLQKDGWKDKSGKEIEKKALYFSTALKKIVHQEYIKP